MDPDEERLRRFEAAVLPHLDAAHDLARWLTRSDADAGDVVQEACVRALRYFDGFRGTAVKPWFLAVVRNAANDWMSRRPPATGALDDDAAPAAAREESSEAGLLRADERASLARALDELPAEFREAVVLRELEGLSYKEIAAVVGAPIGTVMSRLSRGRRLLLRSMGGEEGRDEV